MAVRALVAEESSKVEPGGQVQHVLRAEHGRSRAEQLDRRCRQSTRRPRAPSRASRECRRSTAPGGRAVRRVRPARLTAQRSVGRRCNSALSVVRPFLRSTPSRTLTVPLQFWSRSRSSGRPDDDVVHVGQPASGPAEVVELHPIGPEPAERVGGPLLPLGASLLSCEVLLECLDLGSNPLRFGSRRVASPQRPPPFRSMEGTRRILAATGATACSPPKGERSMIGGAWHDDQSPHRHSMQARPHASICVGPPAYRATKVEDEGETWKGSSGSGARWARGHRASGECDPTPVGVVTAGCPHRRRERRRRACGAIRREGPLGAPHGRRRHRRPRRRPGRRGNRCLCASSAPGWSGRRRVIGSDTARTRRPATRGARRGYGPSLRTGRPRQRRRHLRRRRC